MRVCPACGTENPEKARFCHECGTALADTAAPTPAAGEERKLIALRECLKGAELSELTEDGRGKLLIFTEHRDTLEHLLRKLEEWGYTTTHIHGGMSPQDRRRRPE